MSGGILAFLGKILSDAFGKFFADVIAGWRHDAALRESAQAQAALKTDEVIDDMRDKQAAVDAADRSGADAVAERLRKRVAGKAGRSPE